MGGMSYARARRLLLVGGTAVLAVTAAVLYLRRVDTVEVVAVLLFLPIFVAFVFWNAAGGLMGALLAIACYVALRYPAVDAVGAGRFTGLILSRAVAYLAFGGAGGWANRQLEASLVKLDLYDQVDDATGLNNARFFVQDTDLELARARRYQTIFSVAVVDVPASALDGLGRRPRANALRALGQALRDSVRTVDRPVHARDTERHRLAVVLPETGPNGARIFVDRLAAAVGELLRRHGAEVDGAALRTQVLTLPDDEAALQALREEFAAIDRAEHPTAPA